MAGAVTVDEPAAATRVRWSRRAAADALFPVAPAGAGRDPRRDALVAGGLMAGLAVLSLARQAGIPALDSVWAEDGPVFLVPAARDGVWAALTTSYAGYLHLLPRLLAEVAAQVPLRWTAVVLSLVAAVVTGASGALVEAASAGHVRSRAVRVTLASLVVLHPVMASETLNSIALSQWPLAFAAFWVALWRPRSRAGRAVAAVTLAVAALSAPLALVAAPLLLVRLTVVPGRDRVVPAVGLAAAAVQAVAILVLPDTGQGAAAGPGNALVAYAQRVVATGVLGYAGTEALWPRLGGVVVGLVVLAVVGVLVLGLVRGAPSARLAVLVLAGGSLVTFLGAVAVRDVTTVMLWDGETAVRSGARFAVVPILLLASALAVVVDAELRRGRRVLPGVAAGLVLALALMDFRMVNGRTTGRTWSAELADAEAACAAPGAPAVVDVRLPPAHVGDWRVPLPCDGVRAGRLDPAPLTG